MSKNGIAWLPTKEARQLAKLEITQAKRQGYVVADDGTVTGSPDPAKPYYRTNNVYDVALLPRRYLGNDLVDESLTVNPLVANRPWLNLIVGLNVSPAVVNEGDTFIVSLFAPNVPNGTLRPYTITGVTSADINGAPLTGNFVINNGVATLSFTITADATTEGPETFTLTMDDSPEDTAVVTINDTSLTPTYAAVPRALTVDEGSTIVYDINTTSVPTGTTLYFTVTGTVEANDFFGGVLPTGSFTINNNAGSVSFALAADTTTEGAETIIFQIRTESTSGPIVATAETVTVNDTSLTPAAQSTTLQQIQTIVADAATELEAWYDASDPAFFIPGNPADNATFTQWTDKSAGQHNANPIGGATTRASYQSDALSLQNSLSVVRFDGNDGLSINPYPSLANGTGYTIFVVPKMTATAGNPRLFTTNTGTMGLYYDSTAGRWTVAASGGVGQSTVTNDSSVFHLHTFVYDGTQTGNANRLKYRYDQQDITLTFTGTVGATSNAANNIMFLGCNNAANYYTGDIAEFLVFTRTLTAQEILNVEHYLREKWFLGYSAGLYRTTHSGYFADNPSWFSASTPIASTADSTLAVASISESTNYQWVGYFRPTTTETYTFYTSSDDASFLWIGPSAVSGFTTANALVNNGGEHGTVERSGAVALTAGQLYAIRIQCGNNGGPGTMTTSFSTPTIAKTSNLTGYIFYNTITNGL